MKTMKTIETKQGVNVGDSGDVANKEGAFGDLNDEALDRPANGISVQCACFTFSYSAGSPR